ncbi:MAG: carbohydrate ABC transporter permease, partial [Rhizobiales bacterium]|nr:carbohydrate ABC transporter permease [Hyphomicrobiales bacterium]
MASLTASAHVEPSGPRPKRIGPARYGVYAFLIISALFFLIPLYVMIVTSLKPMDEIRLGNLFALPMSPSFDAWVKAWSQACTGLNCNGIHVGMLNSIKILVPSVILSIAVGSVTGYALSFWRPKGANVLF